MIYDVIYNKPNGSLNRKSFTNMKDTFNFFWKQKGGASPLITSNSLMSTFSFRDIRGFRSREEGKEFAYKAFVEYVRDYKK